MGQDAPKKDSRYTQIVLRGAKKVPRWSKIAPRLSQRPSLFLSLSLFLFLSNGGAALSYAFKGVQRPSQALKALIRGLGGVYIKNCSKDLKKHFELLEKGFVFERHFRRASALEKTPLSME